MEFAQDSTPYSDLGFISQNKKIFSPDEVILPNDKCNTVAVSPRYGLVFCSNGNVVKVFQTQALLSNNETPVASIDCGFTVTHLTTSCDGLTLCVFILQDDKPKVLFYEVRFLTSGCASPAPYAVSSLGGSRVQAVARNPMDPCSVAIATSPGELITLSIKDDKIEANSKAYKACALSWSPKGKQLTVGLADGMLAMFKPDLTLVRTVKNPPMEEVSSVQSITWFTNTEFFIGYRSEAEEGAQVMMYVNAPKNQEPKFVVYEFICNENGGPRPSDFYQVFLPEWSVLCLASSRAIDLGVLGQPQPGTGGWCEYEIEEERKAVMHCINVTEFTYPLGMAVDFTSQQTFTDKLTNKVSGPGPVLYVMSTGGELNIFHVINNKQGVDSLVSPAETLPKTGHRIADQYKGSVNSALSFAKPPTAAAPPLAMTSSFMSPSGIPNLGIKFDPPKFVSSSEGASSTTLGASLFGGQTSQPKPLTPQFNVQTPMMGGLGSGTAVTTAQAAPVMPQFTKQSPMTAGLLSGATIPSAQPAPQIPQFNAPTTIPESVGSGKTLPTSTQIQFNSGTPLLGSLLKTESKDNSQPQMAQSSTPGNLPANPLVSTPVKSQTPSPIHSTPLVKPSESQVASKSPSPLLTSVPVSAKEKEAGDKKVLNLISCVISNFETELQCHHKDINYEVGSRDEMAKIRHSLGDKSVWIEQMSKTTSELKTEIALLHSEVLQGFKLREEAEVQMAKSKHPRYLTSMKSRQLDPHSRKTLDDIQSKYQYLQSQLEEVNTRLHLDWVNYTNALKNKKRRDLPISETLYNALVKCQRLRTRQERDIDSLCDRLKSLEVDGLSHGLRANRQKKNDDIIANLEKSLNEVNVSPSAYVSPVKMLSQGKQQKLQKILSQRNTIPVKKCSSPSSTSFADLSSSQLLQGSAYSKNVDTSFGPQTHSTPNRISKTSLGFGSASPADNIKSSNFLSGSKNGLALNNDTTEDFSSRKIGFTVPQFTSTKASSKGIPGSSISLGTTKPVYEDISPPQTPENKADSGLKSASPLLALSSLVSKVPTTTAEEASSLSDAPIATNFSAVASSSAPFSFNPISASVGTNSSISSSIPALSGKMLPKFTTANLSTGQFLGSSTSSAQITNPLVSVNSGSSLSFSFKGTSLGDKSSGDMFTVKTPVATSPFASVGTSSSISSSSVGSPFNVVSSSASASVFGGNTVSSQLSLGVSAPSSPSVITTTASGQSVKLPTVSISSSKVTNEANESSTNTATFSFNVTSAAPLPTASEKFIGSDSSVLSKPGLFSLVSPPTPDKSIASQTSEPSLSGLSSGKLFESTTASSTKLFETAKSLLSSDSVIGTSTATSSTFKTPVSTTISGSSASTGTVFDKVEPTVGISMFGDAKLAESGGLFALPAKSADSGSLFSSPKTTESGSVFSFSKTSDSGGIFGTAKVSQSASMFGGVSSSGSIFGGATLSSTQVKSTTPTSSSTTTTFAGTTVQTVTTSSSAGNLFGGISTSAPSSSTGGIFGGNTSSIASTPATTMFNPPAVSSSGSIFGSSAPTSTGFVTSPTTSAAFGSPATTSAALGSPATASSAFGSIATTSTAFGSPATTSTAFGTLATTSTAFGSTATTSTAFGSPATTSTAFGSPATTSTAFGSPATTPTAFGTPASTTASIFGTSSSSSSFGSSGAVSGGSVFGSTPAATTTASGSVFGSSSASQGISFGQPTAFGSSSTSASSAFGSLSTTSTASAFPSSGTASNVTATSSGTSVFGQKLESAFGQTTPAASPSIFGGQPSSTGSIFGGTTQSQGSVFGSPATPQQGGNSIFGGSSAQTSGSSIFGQSSAASSTSGNSVFGQSTPTATSPFASATPTQNAATASPFSSSGFGVGNTSSSGGGGGFFSGLGSKPSEENANKNVFGSTTFASAKPQLSLFGGNNQASTTSFGAAATSTGSFGQTSTSSFGNPTFGGGTNTGVGNGSEASQSTFGMTSPQKTGFGSNTAFGGAPVFGGTPAFGSPPKFGSTSIFGGSTGGAFGSSPATGGGGFSNFGSPAAGSSTFGAPPTTATASPSGFGGFASQSSTATFGGLAKQSPVQQQQPQGSAFGGGSSFSTWR